MKKIGIIIMVLLLSGCFENSGYLTNTCTKVEQANTLTSTTTYTIGFKNDIIDSVVVSNDYQDTDMVTISSIKLSMETQNKYYQDKVDISVLKDEQNHYHIEYTFDLKGNQEILDTFFVKEKRSEMVKILKEEGFTCK